MTVIEVPDGDARLQQNAIVVGAGGLFLADNLLVRKVNTITQ